jgi:integrase/recombinase XerD
VAVAIEKFLRDKIETLIPGPPLTIESAIGHSDTIRKYNDILKRFGEFAELKGIVCLEDVSTDILNQFRETWKGVFDFKTKTFKAKSLTGKQKYQESLKIFFRFAHEMEWIARNPAAKLSSYRLRKTNAESEEAEKKRTPLQPSDIQAILARLPEVFPKTTNKVRAFFLVLASTSLRIGDVVSLQRSNVKGSKMMLATRKTNRPVFLKLPPVAVKALADFTPVSKTYFFWTGNGKLDTAKADWSEKMLRLYRAAGVQQRSHAFRDTLTTAVLGTGGNLETAAALLGHRDIRITQKHYEHWGAERQKMLEEALERAWQKNGLAEAKKPILPRVVLDLIESGKREELIAALEKWIA